MPFMHFDLHMRGAGEDVVYCPGNVLRYSQMLSTPSSIIFLTSDWRQGTLLWMAATLSGLSGYMAAWNSVWTNPGMGTLSMRCKVWIVGDAHLGRFRTLECCPQCLWAPVATPLEAQSQQTSRQRKTCRSCKWLCLNVLIICLVEGFGGTLCPDIDPIMMICPSSILLETMESTLSWVHRQRADVMFRVSSTTNYDISYRVHWHPA